MYFLHKRKNLTQNLFKKFFNIHILYYYNMFFFFLLKPFIFFNLLQKGITKRQNLLYYQNIKLIIDI